MPKEVGEYWLADKPSGLSTHRTSQDGPLGFVEYLETQRKQRLYVCHRLDKETTGAIVFASTPESARELSEKFASREVKKTYLFVTDRPHQLTSFTASSAISKIGNKFVSAKSGPDQAANAITHFQYLREEAGYYLWQAQPETGKPHQIRLQAQDSGIPVLGDRAHGGSNFPSLMLHSYQLSVDLPSGPVEHMAAPPALMTNLGLCRDQTLATWLSALDRRQRLFNLDPLSQKTNGYRLVHSEGGPLRADLLGEVLWLYWFHEEAPALETIEQFVSLTPGRFYQLQLRLNRGQNPLENPTLQSTPPPPQTWTITENGLRFEMRLQSGLSSGLFLDQRENRRWVFENSKGLRVLNLFSYTGGFSVAAAKGGAKQVTTVDTSRTTLDWARSNFQHNDLSPEDFEFYAQDAREFLRLASKKGREFDLIICDPPSFARSKKGIFQIGKDLEDLVVLMNAVLAPTGTILFATNFEKWSIEDLHEQMRKLFRQKNLKFTLCTAPGAGFDFEVPGEEPMMKSVFLTKVAKNADLVNDRKK